MSVGKKKERKKNNKQTKKNPTNKKNPNNNRLINLELVSTIYSLQMWPDYMKKA